MNKYFFHWIGIVFFQILFWNEIKSQEFAPLGTQWIYTSEESAFTAYRPYYIEVVGEENFKGKICKKLLLNHQQAAYIYQDSLKVYAYSKETGQFYLLYDFDAKLGEIVRMDNISVGTDKQLGSCLIRIDSIISEIICGKTRKSWYYTNIQNDTFYLWEMGNKYIEEVGDLKYLFPQYSLASPQIGDLRCYQDPFHECKFVNYACDTTFYTNTQNEVEKIIKIWPNPINDILYIQLELYNGSEILIRDIQGRYLPLSGSIISDHYIVDVSSLTSGIYFIIIRDHETTNVGKFIVQHGQ
ncbi:MAG: T9SS type A sorting domain-containing protein [Saprospiraceae bacterium]|jgi:hypothetical protein